MMSPHTTHSTFSPRDAPLECPDVDSARRQFTYRCAKGHLKLQGGFPFPFVCDTLKGTLHPSCSAPYQSHEYGFTDPLNRPSSAYVTITYTPPDKTRVCGARYHSWKAHLRTPSTKKGSYGELPGQIHSPSLAEVYLEDSALHSELGYKIATDKRILQRALALSSETERRITVLDRIATLSPSLPHSRATSRRFVFIGTSPSGHQEILGYV